MLTSSYHTHVSGDIVLYTSSSPNFNPQDSISGPHSFLDTPQILYSKRQTFHHGANVHRNPTTIVDEALQVADDGRDT